MNLELAEPVNMKPPQLLPCAAGHRGARSYVRRGKKAEGGERTMAEPQQGDNHRGAIVGLVVVAVLLAAGIWLARELTSASRLQDCVMSGRTNCNVIEPAR